MAPKENIILSPNFDQRRSLTSTSMFNYKINDLVGDRQLQRFFTLVVFFFFRGVKGCLPVVFIGHFPGELQHFKK